MRREEETYRCEGEAISPVAVTSGVCEVLVCVGDGGAEEAEGYEGEKDADEAEDGLESPARVLFRCAAANVGAKEEHGR